MLKLDQRFAVDNAVEGLHKYSARPGHQVLALLAKCQTTSYLKLEFIQIRYKVTWLLKDFVL
jgi:hypothetical protein